MVSMSGQDADTRPAGHPDTAEAARRTPADTLRFIPPVSALGTAFVLQTIAITDTVGSALSARYGPWMYLAAALLGVSVASCAEGGAAYLMDLYDKHLLAGDSVWLLRLSMLLYVAASGAVIHWWTSHRGLPELISWLLAGMSASALFLWSRGSRWRRREAMREQGLIDSAMPRLSVAAKMLHPVRWLITLYLVSWDPARTPAEARARYDHWRTHRRTGSADTTDSLADTQEVDTEPEAPTGRRTSTRPVLRPPVPDSGRKVIDLSATRRRPSPRTPGTEPSVEQLADTLGRVHKGRIVGKPKALETLRRVHGSCSNDRAIAAKDLHNERVRAEPDADDEERESDPELVGVG
jgi:hypothetical protein